jgi:hypothetical protein
MKMPFAPRPSSALHPSGQSLSAVGALLMTLPIAACTQPPASPWAQEIAEVEARLTDAFTPGLHTLMVEMQHRHATLWFAGDSENWPLADYFLHELEELVEDIEELHPEYAGVPVADLLAEMTMPAVERMEDAVDAEDREAFIRAYDQLTVACNACHVASDRAAIVIQRPTAPPLTNLRYIPRP